MRTEVAGVPLDAVTPQSFTEQVVRWVQGQRCATVATPNPEFVVRAQNNEDFRAALLSTDLNLPDGTGTVAASFFLHGQRLRRLTGVTATKLVCQAASAHGWRVVLCGGQPDVAAAAAARLAELYPRLNVTATQVSPEVTTQGRSPDDESIIEELRLLKAQVLLVAFGAPKQELWIYRNHDKLTEVGVRLAMGVGGTFDYLAGNVPTPPRLVSHLGFEWLWRLLRQPRRLPRIWRSLVVFSWYVLRWRRQLRRPLRQGVTAVIINESSEVLLMLSTWGGREGWVLPGGGVETGESVEQAALREAAEETGLSRLTVERVAAEPYAYRWPLTWRRDGYGGKSTTVVILRYTGGKSMVAPKADEGFIDHRWVAAAELVSSLPPIHKKLGLLVLNELQLNR